MTTYCLIEDNRIIDGPMLLPPNYNDFKGKSWYPVVSCPPAYDKKTQQLVIKGMIIEWWVVMIEYEVVDLKE